MISGADRRGAPRVRYSLSVLCFIREETSPSQTLDISASGCALLLDARLDICASFPVQILLPGRRLDCIALVRGIRVQQEGRVVGVEFGHLKSDDRDVLADFVRLHRASVSTMIPDPAQTRASVAVHTDR